MLIPFDAKGNTGRVLFNLKQDCYTVSLDEEVVYSFDAEGRLLTLWQGGRTYVRTLDNRLVAKWHKSNSPRSRKSVQCLDESDKSRVISGVCSAVQDLKRRLEDGELVLADESLEGGPAHQMVASILEKLGAWDLQRYQQEEFRFDSVYSPVSILPLDQYYSLVLQATVGCHWNRCTFCDFYRHVPFHIRTPQEFADHIRAVRNFMGDGLRLRRSIFLGDANALVTPQARLLQIFDLVNIEFPEISGNIPLEAGRRNLFQGIYSFLDVFTGEKKTMSDYRELKARNLKRVYVGVETGCDDLLKFLNKPATSAQAQEVISEIKQAGIHVGVIILIGVGGSRYSELHVLETTRILNALHLDGGDLIYFSPLWDFPGSEYSQRLAAIGIPELTGEEKRDQLEEMRSGLCSPDGDKPRIALYDIREFVY